MPIIERTAEEAVRVFRRHLAEVVSGTLTRTIPLLHLKVGDRWLVEFRQGEKGATVPLNTRHGKTHLYLGQLLETVEENGRHRLQTLQYWYRVQNAPEPSERATLRWEYNRDAQQTARHHAHAVATVQIGTSQVDLDKVHLPTGWVTIEEVIRFVIQELPDQERPRRAELHLVPFAGVERVRRVRALAHGVRLAVQRPHTEAHDTLRRSPRVLCRRTLPRQGILWW